MTTILFDPVDRALYADMQMTMGNLIATSNKQKLKVVHHPDLGECLAGGAGAIDEIEAALHYLIQGGDKPTLKDISVILITKAGDLYNAFEGQLRLIKMPFSADAIGSGMTIALAVLHATQNPLQAMQTAKALDIYTGGAIQKGWFDGERWCIETIDA